MRGSKNIRKFERFLFKGVPEQPETVWERNDNTNVFMRQTGKSQCSPAVTVNPSSEGKVLGYYSFNLEDQTESFVETL